MEGLTMVVTVKNKSKFKQAPAQLAMAAKHQKLLVPRIADLQADYAAQKAEAEAAKKRLDEAVAEAVAYAEGALGVGVDQKIEMNDNHYRVTLGPRKKKSIIDNVAVFDLLAAEDEDLPKQLAVFPVKVVNDYLTVGQREQAMTVEQDGARSLKVEKV